MASTKTFPSNALIPSSLHFSPAPTLNARLHARDSFSTGVHAFWSRVKWLGAADAE